MFLPENINVIIETLEKNGFDAYVVGGCVRDYLLKLTPKDYDIATSATPEQVLTVFKNFRTIQTGLKHGTVTVMSDDMAVEITTFRIDGKYDDNRHPNEVSFTSDIKTDLSRRDFTINAMAFNKKTGIVDFFGGQDDLKSGIIRAVGNPDLRFEEDSLRILRALRFAARYGFSLDMKTADAVHKCKDLLKNIAAERINVEFCGILTGNCEEILRDYVDVIGIFIPEILKCVGFIQNNPYHNRDVYEHIIATVMAIEPKIEFRLTMFLHDIGKPECYIIKDGVGHFYGHAKVSADIGESVLKRLKFSNKISQKVLFLVKQHDLLMKENSVFIKKWLNKFGNENFLDLIKVHIADNMGKCEEFADRNNFFMEIEKNAIKIISEQQCLKIKDLAVNGNDVAKKGYCGREIGDKLNFLLNCVLENKCENDKQKLLDLI